MTRERAHDVATEQAMRTGTPHVVYRFAGWPPNVWGVLDRTHAELPSNVTVHETVDPPSTTAEPSLF